MNEELERICKEGSLRNSRHNTDSFLGALGKATECFLQDSQGSGRRTLPEYRHNSSPISIFSWVLKLVLTVCPCCWFGDWGINVRFVA